MQGPYPIFCRGHSGGRLLCEVFIRNGIEMGYHKDERNDTKYFSVKNTIIREIVMNSMHYYSSSNEQKQYFQNLMKQCVDQFIKQQVQRWFSPKRPFGWKMGTTLFTMPVVLDTFPDAKVIHLIRDGRDVMLSRNNSRFKNINDPLNKLVIFGNALTDNYEGHALTPETINTYRNELEMLYWVTAVSYGIKGRKYDDRYLEVKYEDICTDPLQTIQKIFDFLEIPFLKSTQRWIKENAHSNRIGK